MCKYNKGTMGIVDDIQKRIEEIHSEYAKLHPGYNNQFNKMSPEAKQFYNDVIVPEANLMFHQIFGDVIEYPKSIE
jgi:hypothetical protein